MNLRQWILWKPAFALRGLLLLAGFGLILLLGYFTTSSAWLMEFHVLFALRYWSSPGSSVFARHCLSVLAVGVWFVTDCLMGDELADLLPLLFNTVMRLSISSLGLDTAQCAWYSTASRAWHGKIRSPAWPPPRLLRAGAMPPKPWPTPKRPDRSVHRSRQIQAERRTV
jgi:hypothetical protein